jgi:hypothetical protein
MTVVGDGVSIGKWAGSSGASKRARQLEQVTQIKKHVSLSCRSIQNGGVRVAFTSDFIHEGRPWSFKLCENARVNVLVSQNTLRSPTKVRN